MQISAKKRPRSDPKSFRGIPENLRNDPEHLESVSATFRNVPRVRFRPRASPCTGSVEPCLHPSTGPVRPAQGARTRMRRDLRPKLSVRCLHAGLSTCTARPIQCPSVVPSPVCIPGRLADQWHWHPTRWMGLRVWGTPVLNFLNPPPPPPQGGPPPPLQTKVTIVGKNEIYNRENLVGPFLVHKRLGPRSPPPLPSTPPL